MIQNNINSVKPGRYFKGILDDTLQEFLLIIYIFYRDLFVRSLIFSYFIYILIILLSSLDFPLLGG